MLFTAKEKLRHFFKGKRERGCHCKDDMFPLQKMKVAGGLCVYMVDECHDKTIWLGTAHAFLVAIRPHIK